MKETSLKAQHGAANDAIVSYADFWPFYLREHRSTGARRLHYIGTALGTLAFGACIATRQWRLFPLALAVGYGPAWMAHFLIERNRPATFRYPLWSLASDYRMVWLALTGQLGRELVQAGADRAS